jgi:SAM-dependent methyltransferase
MNSRIFNLIIKNIEISFKLPKYQKILQNLSKNTVIQKLPWTPVRFEKFQRRIEESLDLYDIDYNRSIEEVTKDLSQRYLARFFGEIWKPTTDIYVYSGWALVDEINSQNPVSVLDVGCGYNQFKGRIHNLIGIDPYNNCADFMVDVLDFRVNDTYDHILVLGSLNFNSYDEIEQRFEKIVSLLKDNGKIYFRANPGILWKNGPYVDIFNWTFEIVYNLSQKYNLKLETYKKDSNDRLYFVYLKQ